MATTEGNNTNRIANALYDVLTSPNELDRNLEAANVVDGLFAVARTIRMLAIVTAIANGITLEQVDQWGEIG